MVKSKKNKVKRTKRVRSQKKIQRVKRTKRVQRTKRVKRTSKRIPKLIFPSLESINDLKRCNINDFVLEGYDPHPPIKAEMAV